MNHRGYFGIGIYQPKHHENVGTLWRSAFQLGASFIFTIGKRHKKQASDTVKAFKHIPLYEYGSIEDLKMPYDCQLIAVEFGEGSRDIQKFAHPEKAIYLLGAEDHGLPPSALKKCQYMISLPSIRTPSYNVAVAGSIVMYDRLIK